VMLYILSLRESCSKGMWAVPLLRVRTSYFLLKTLLFVVGYVLVEELLLAGESFVKSCSVMDHSNKKGENSY